MLRLESYNLGDVFEAELLALHPTDENGRISLEVFNRGPVSAAIELSPDQARKLAAFLLEWADQATAHPAFDLDAAANRRA